MMAGAFSNMASRTTKPETVNKKIKKVEGSD